MMCVHIVRRVQCVTATERGKRAGWYIIGIYTLQCTSVVWVRSDRWRGDRTSERENYTDTVTAVEKSLFFDEIYKILTFPTNRNENDGDGGVQY